MTVTRYVSRGARGLSLHPGILCLLWSVWLALPHFAFGSSSYIRIHDTGDGYLPALVALRYNITSGQLGYWNAQAVAGADRVAASPLELDNLPFFVLPGWLAYGLVIWLQRFIAGYFAFRLLKESLAIDTTPALYGALAYSLFAQNTINAQWDGFTLYDGLALPGLPLISWAMWRMSDQITRRKYAFAAGLGLLLALTSSFVFTLFLMPIIIFWFVFITPRRRFRFWVMLLCFGGAWLIGQLPILWASGLNAPLSQRATWIPDSPLSTGIVGSWAFVRGQIGDNLASIVLIGAGLISGRWRDRKLIALVIGIAVSLVFVGSYPFIQTLILGHLGFLSGFQFDRVYLTVPFLTIVAASLGLHHMQQTSTQRLPRQTLSLQTILMIGAFGIVGLESLIAKPLMLKEIALGRNFDSLYEQPELQRLSKRQDPLSPFRVATVFSADRPLHPAYAWAYGLETADGYINLYSKRYQEYWEQVIAPVSSIDQDQYNYFHYWGNRVYLFAPTTGFLSADGVNVSDYYNLELLSLANVRYIISPISLRDERLTLVSSSSDRLDCTTLNRTDQLMAMLHGQCLHGGPLYIYENRNVLPRFFLVTHVSILDEPSNVLAALRTATHADLQSTAYLAKADVADQTFVFTSATTSEVHTLHYSADEILLDVTSNSPAILIVTNSFNPYWQAHIGAASARVFPVDHAFQGIYVSAGGRHRIRLQYNPPYAIRLGQ